MARKTFLHICLSEAWGGLEMAVSNWNEVLKFHGHRNVNICTPDSPLSKDLQLKGFNTLNWDSTDYFAPDFTYKLHKLTKKYKIDVIILQSLRDLWIVSPALYRKKNIKLIGFCQMLVGVKKRDLLHRMVYSRLDHLCTLTKWQIGALLPYLPVAREKYTVIPNFVDCERFHPKRRSSAFRHQFGIKDDEFAIGIIGRLDKQKGQKELIEAFAKISSKFLNTKLVIVGDPTLNEEGEDYKNLLHQMVQQYDLEKRVIFNGFRQDVNLVTAAFDLFVLASYRETFGYVVVEAMASGTPVLGTDAGGVTEILGSGEFGFLCKPKNSTSLADQLEYILAHPEERKRKAEAALKQVRKTYEKNKVYNQLKKLYQ